MSDYAGCCRHCVGSRGGRRNQQSEQGRQDARKVSGHPAEAAAPRFACVCVCVITMAKCATLEVIVDLTSFSLSHTHTCMCYTNQVVTPDLKLGAAGGQLLLVDLASSPGARRMGGSALAQAYDQVWRWRHCVCVVLIHIVCGKGLHASSSLCRGAPHAVRCISRWVDPAVTVRITWPNACLGMCSFTLCTRHITHVTHVQLQTDVCLLRLCAFCVHLWQYAGWQRVP